MKFVPNENVLRVALLVFSIIFGMLSVALICLGIVYIDELEWPHRYVALDFLELPTLLIVLGSCSLLMSIAGCLTSKSYNRKIFVTFATCLALILCLELAIAVIAFRTFQEHRGGRSVANDMLEQLSDPNEKGNFQDLQAHLNCCGITGVPNNCDSSYLTCDQVVADKILSVASEVGYFAVILCLLQVVHIGYVLLIHNELST